MLQTSALLHTTYRSFLFYESTEFKPFIFRYNRETSNLIVKLLPWYDPPTKLLLDFWISV